jgi:hypothetical protein
MEELAAPVAIPTPRVVEKELIKEPLSVEAPTAPKPVVVTEAGLSITDIEQFAERAAWASAEKVARDIIQELVPNLAREAATQVARSVAEDLGRRAAHAAVRAAQEAA